MKTPLLYICKGKLVTGLTGAWKMLPGTEESRSRVAGSRRGNSAESAEATSDPYGDFLVSFGGTVRGAALIRPSPRSKGKHIL